MNHLHCSQDISDQIWLARNKDLSEKILNISYLLRMPSIFLVQWILSWPRTVLTGSHILKGRKLKRERLLIVSDLSLSNRVTSLHSGDSSLKVVFLNPDFTLHKGLFLYAVQPFWTSNFSALPAPGCSCWSLFWTPQEAERGYLRTCIDGRFSQESSGLCPFVVTYKLSSEEVRILISNRGSKLCNSSVKPANYIKTHIFSRVLGL